MFVFQLLLSLAWLIIPVLIIYLLVRRKNPGPADQYSSVNAQRDQMWRDYLASFKSAVKTDKEKHLIETLIIGKSANELYGGASKTAEVTAANQTAASGGAVKPAQSTMAVQVAPAAAHKTSTPIDNTILLLYFGAFLLVASVGLFVAIGGLDGVSRTLIVGATSALLYFGGLYIHATSKKLSQAGISFVGTGMMVAPLTGVAYYNLVAGQSSGGLIWLITSLGCIAMYNHAFSRLKNAFIAYLLIGSLVSSIESAVLTVNLPAYAYAWGMIAAGFLLIYQSRNKNTSLQFSSSSSVSSQLLIPLSIAGSVALLPHNGSMQLAVTLILSGIFYTLQALWQDGNKPMMAAAAQTSYIAALCSGVFANQHTPVSIGITLTAVTVLYCAVITNTGKEAVKTYGLMSIAAAASGLSILLSLGDAWPLVISMVSAALLAAAIWWKLKSNEALQMGGLVLIGLPFVAGLYALNIELGSWQQLYLGLLSLAVLAGLLFATGGHESKLSEFYHTSSVLYIFGSATILVPAAFLGFTAVGGAVLLLVASFVMVYLYNSDSSWLQCSAVAALLPFSYAFFRFGIDSTAFGASLWIALAWNIWVSLITRESLVRWLVVGCILLAPFALGGGGLGIRWSDAGYALGYLLAMAGCIAARAIARGRMFISLKVPITSYYTEASQAYVVGYVASAVLSVFVSLDDTRSQLITTLILGAIMAAAILVSKIERRSELLAVQPLLLQMVLFSAIRPDLNDPASIGVMALVSTSAAALAYYCVSLFSLDMNASKLIRSVCVISAYAGPVLAITQPHPSLLLPLSLLLAGLLTFHYNRSAKQYNKELSLAVCIAAVHWFVLLLGYSNIHVHTHMLALFLAGFAYWRSSINDREAVQSYVQALYLVVTVPLILQSLSGENGGPYGLTLIVEQAFFMIAGASLQQKFLLRWGLWTALAAVLFQLRGLGWAFLSLLAITVIGIAVYRLQKHPPDN